MKFEATFLKRDNDDAYREFYASDLNQATHKAKGIAKSNGWKLVQVIQLDY
jgi:uncharacterized protein YggE